MVKYFTSKRTSIKCKTKQVLDIINIKHHYKLSTKINFSLTKYEKLSKSISYPETEASFAIFDGVSDITDLLFLAIVDYLFT